MYLFLLIILGAVTYRIYKDPLLLNDMYYYWKMRLEEYMGIDSFEDIYDEEPCIIFTSGSNDSDDNSKEGKEDTHPTSIESLTETSILTVVVNDFIAEFQKKCISFYFELLKTYSYIEIEWKTMSSKNAFIGYINSAFIYIWSKIRRLTSTHLIEPDEKEWINNIVFYRTQNRDGSFSYNIDEKYMFVNGNTCIRTQTEYYIQQNKERKAIIGKLKTMPSYIFQQLEFIVMTKYIDDNAAKYIVSLSNNPLDRLVLSNAKFMSIEYTHPLMSESIPLELPVEMFLAGNEILSAGFILRALKHQCMRYVFDLDYIIKVVDGMVNMFELKSSDHILLTQNGYLVKSNSDK